MIDKVDKKELWVELKYLFDCWRDDHAVQVRVAFPHAWKLFKKLESKA